MDSIKQKAAYFRVSLQLGVSTVADVIRWADAEIEQVDKPLYEDLGSPIKRHPSREKVSPLEENYIFLS